MFGAPFKEHSEATCFALIHCVKKKKVTTSHYCMQLVTTWSSPCQVYIAPPTGNTCTVPCAAGPKALKHKFISMHRQSLSVCVWQEREQAGVEQRGDSILSTLASITRLSERFTLS